MARPQIVLVIEDDADLRRMLRTALSFAGFRVFEAGDGHHGLRLIEEQRPDAVVLDLGLPTVSGHVVLQDLAAHAHTSDIPVVVVTGLDGDHESLEAACVLRKPVSPERVVLTVRSCILSGSSAARS